MKIPTGRLALAAAAMLALAVAGIGAASAAAPAGAPDPVQRAVADLPVLPADDNAAALDAPRLRQLLGRRMVHAEIVVDRGEQGLVTVQADRGTVKAIGAGSLTIAEAGSRTETVATTEKTRVRKDRQKATLADLRVGDPVLVLSQLDGGKAQASLVVVPPAKAARPAKAPRPASPASPAPAGTPAAPTS
jgi:hypothetical protein